MSLTPGDTYISTLATYISTNSTRLASSPLPQPTRRPPASSSSSSSYTSYLLPPALYAGAPPKPLSLRLTPQNLFYLLLRFQAIGLDVGELDVPLGRDVQRAMSLVEVSGADIARRRREERRSETGSFRSVAGSMVSGLSLGGWWGTGKVKDPDADLKLIYSAFTKLPSIVLHAAGLQDEVIEEMAGSGPLDTAVPLKVFKNLQVLEIVSLPPSALIVPSSHTLRSLTIRAVDSPMNDEEGEWLVPVLFGEKEGVLEQRRRERMVGPGGRAGVRSRNPSAASAVMGGVGEDDEEEGSPDPSRDSSNGGLLQPPSTKPALLPSPTSLDGPGSPASAQQLKFPHLSHLALPSLSLLTLPQLPIPSLVSLDLSHNLLLTLPPNLICFPNLLALNLEGNMINSLRGADQLLPSAPVGLSSSAPPSSYRNGGTPSRLSRPALSRTGLKVLNLDSNRISNLHGLSGLIALQRLSLRNNSISESLELSRLTALPTLVDLYVLPNPFITNPSEEDWRVRLWDGFAREGREETGCPKVDGEGVSWSERRRMKAPFPTDGGAAIRRASRAEMEVPKSPPIVPVGGTLVQHSRKSSNRTPGSSRRVGSTMSAEGDVFAAPAPSPPPVAKAKAPPSSYHPPASSQTLSPTSAGPPVRRKRRHRRIVNLDGGEDSGTATGTDLSEDETASAQAGKTNGARHQRASSERKSPAVAAQEVLLAAPSAAADADSSPTTSTGPPPATPTTPNHSSLRSPPSSTARASARRARVSASVYEPSTSSTLDPPPGAGPPSPPHGAGSGDEFRKKLEAMRLEVGDSWLRVLSAGGTGAEASPPLSGAEDRRRAEQGKAREEPTIAAAEEIGVTRVVKKVKKKKKAAGVGNKTVEEGAAGEGSSGV